MRFERRTLPSPWRGVAVSRPQLRRDAGWPRLRSPAAPEQLIELAQTDLAPGRPAVVALVGALGGSIWRSSAFISSIVSCAVGAHRAVAGHGRQQLGRARAARRAGVVLGQVGEHAARQFDDVAVGQRAGTARRASVRGRTA